MKRARATALALVNWKGVFYERYLLDPHVTALEGANGAGKTTVMIAAYVVLLPDMSRLRFTNVGETGATGGDKGIWGRLGEPGSASYAVLDLALPESQRLIAGVELVRKGEPTIDPAPFIVSDLPHEARLQDLLLQRRDSHDAVPTRAELAANAKDLGARFQSFATTKDYLAALFERGVTPLRLASDEDRSKYNEMLRTSMTGGISRALTSELRSFVLREEAGLGETLSRMRKNLDACHRTRIEVREAQRLEQEMAGVYDAGKCMFQAALMATASEARAHERSVELAREEERRASHEIEELSCHVAQQAERHAKLAERVQAVRAELAQAHARRGDIARACAAAVKLNELKSEREATERRVESAREARHRADSARTLRQSERDQANEAIKRSALGLADIQQGLDELHKRANRRRRARERLEEARALLCEPDLPVNELGGRLALAKQELFAIDRKRARLARDAELVEIRRTEYNEAARALTSMRERPLDEASYEDAVRELARLTELEALVLRAGAQAREIADTEAMARAQERARRRALDLGLDLTAAAHASAICRELERAEQQLRVAENEFCACRDRRQALETEREQASDRLRRAEELASRRALALGVLAGIGELCGEEPWTHDRLLCRHAALSRERADLSLKEHELAEQRALMVKKAFELEANRGMVSPELERLRDELDGELLAQRFEDMEPEAAGVREAALGPLLHALVVDDLEAAARTITNRERESTSVWLVRSDAELPVARARSGKGDVIVEHAAGLRITRCPERPTLGRRARLDKAQALRKEADALASELEAVERRGRRLDAVLRELGPLVDDSSSLGQGEVPESVLDLQRELQRIALAIETQERELRDQGGQVAELVPRVASLRELLPEAHLLGTRNYADEHENALDLLERARAAEQELARVASARSVLQNLLQALRCPPSLESSTELPRLDEERDRWFRIQEALEEAARSADALECVDPEQALADGARLVPVLEQQHEEARRALEAAEALLGEAEAHREAATLEWQAAEGERVALAAQCARVESELGLAGGGRAPDLLAQAHDHATRELEAAAQEAEREERELATALALSNQRRRELEQRCEQATRTLSEALARSEPSAEAVRVVRDRLKLDGFPASTALLFDAAGDRTHEKLWADAGSRAEIIGERLRTARGGAELASELADVPHEQRCRALFYLVVWAKTRSWLASRVPAQVAAVDDPLEALERLRDHLAALEKRLERQEADLRGTSEDIARSIEVQLRRAGSQVRRLNQGLEAISFGSIRGIRVRMQRIERMSQVLAGLREGEAQELLFQSSLPIEEALDEVFRRYGGGRSGGQRLLDYREYVDLAVEILRQTSEEWEPANPTRLSTGEAIGVGAALMMVVLTEWERDANLLRGKREHGSLRFLFLDEANRLSPDNLGVLFNLCQSLDLQLLIAAPEVARAEGNTTYRLVRSVSADGREEVIVSGRRSVMPSSAESILPPDEAVPVPTAESTSEGAERTQRAFCFEG
jgi:chromosome partition protein MukB